MTLKETNICRGGDDLESIDFRGFDFYCNIGVRAETLKQEVTDAVNKFFEEGR